MCIRDRCETSNKLTHDLIRNFKDRGALVSFDVNFRRNLWTEEEARIEIEKLLPFVDILFASEETFRKMFQKTGNLEEIIRAFAKEFNISFIASTQRTVNSPKSHNFTSLIYNRKNNTFYCESPYKNIEIVDRIEMCIRDRLNRYGKLNIWYISSKLSRIALLATVKLIAPVCVSSTVFT